VEAGIQEAHARMERKMVSHRKIIVQAGGCKQSCLGIHKVRVGPATKSVVATWKLMQKVVLKNSAKMEGKVQRNLTCSVRKRFRHCSESCSSILRKLKEWLFWAVSRNPPLPRNPSFTLVLKNVLPCYSFQYE